MKPKKPVAECRGTGWCHRCKGEGAHYHDSYEPVECEVCDGTGECPCQYDSTVHPNPCFDVMDRDEYKASLRP